MANYFQCSECNLFMSYRDVDESVSYVPYGTSYDLEPSDEIYMHKRCWDSMSEDGKNLIKRISYIGPSSPKQAR